MAAMGIGFCCRLIEANFPDLDRCFESINRWLPTLSAVLPVNPYHELRRAVDFLAGKLQGADKNPQQRLSRYEIRQLVSESHLGVAADNAIAEAEGFTAWYAAGVVLGEYCSQICEEGRGSGKRKLVRYEPYLPHLDDFVRTQPSGFLAASPMLRTLTAGLPKGPTLNKLIGSLDRGLQSSLRQQATQGDAEAIAWHLFDHMMIQLSSPAKTANSQHDVVPSEIANESSVVPTSPRLRSVHGEWAHKDPPPANRGWLGPVPGTLTWIAKELAIDPKTLKRRNENGSLWVRTITGKTFELWTQDPAEHNKLWNAANRRDSEAVKKTKS